MKKRGIIIIIILAIVIVSVLFLWLTGSIGFGGYTVTVKGTAYYHIGGAWGVTYNGYSVREAGGLSFNPGALYMPWETKDVYIHVELKNQEGKTYHNEIQIGAMSSITGSKQFTVELNHIPSGSYTGCIYLYEVEKSGILWWNWGESNRFLRETSGISNLVVQ